MSGTTNHRTVRSSFISPPDSPMKKPALPIRICSAAVAGIFLLSQLIPGVALALPQGESVQHGNVQFTRTGNQLTIDQATPRAIVNYGGGFNIAPGEAVRINQPGTGAAILNRVTGGGASQIAGSLSANGQVYLINPSGIIFAPGSSVSVHGLVASAMHLSNTDFLSGRLNFTGPGGSVINHGNISAGFAYLVGGTVQNNGNISSGDTILAAGQRSVVIDRAGPGAITVIIDGEAQGGKPATENSGTEPESDTQNGEANQTANGESSNDDSSSDTTQSENSTGSDSAETTNGSTGGTDENESGSMIVEDTPNAGSTDADMLDTDQEADAVSADISAASTGVTDDHPAASTRESTDGTVATIRINSGDVINQGQINADGDSGGRIVAAGQRVSQQGSASANGIQGAGGEIQLLAREHVEAGSESVTTANAGLHGDGGNITIFSEGNAFLPEGATVEARGGSESGHGGFVEFSGQRHIELHTRADVRAPAGNVGTVLIDPTDIAIEATPSSGGGFTPAPAPFEWTPSSAMSIISDTDLLAQLQLGNVRIETASAFGEAGSISLNAPLDYDGVGTRELSLIADLNLMLNAPIFDGNEGGDNLHLITEAGGHTHVADALEVNRLEISANQGISSGFNAPIGASDTVILRGDADDDGRGAVDLFSDVSGGTIRIQGESFNASLSPAHGGLQAGSGGVDISVDKDLAVMNQITSGDDVRLQSVTGKIEIRANVNADGNLLADAQDGGIRVQPAAEAKGQGNVDLQAAGANNAVQVFGQVESTTGDLRIHSADHDVLLENAAVSAPDGNLELSAAQRVSLGGSSSATADQQLNLLADPTDPNSVINLADTARVLAERVRAEAGNVNSEYETRLESDGGSLMVDATEQALLDGHVHSLGGPVTIDAGGLVRIGRHVDSSDGNASGEIRIEADHVTVNGLVTSGTGGDGILTVRAGAEINQAPSLGPGDVSILGREADLIINTDLQNENDIILQAPNDIIVESAGSLTTTDAGGNIQMQSDTDDDGSGGIQLDGTVASAGNVSLDAAGLTEEPQTAIRINQPLDATAGITGGSRSGDIIIAAPITVSSTGNIDFQTPGQVVVQQDVQNQGSGGILLHGESGISLDFASPGVIEAASETGVALYSISDLTDLNTAVGDVGATPGSAAVRIDAGAGALFLSGVNVDTEQIEQSAGQGISIFARDLARLAGSGIAAPDVVIESGGHIELAENIDADTAALSAAGDVTQSDPTVRIAADSVGIKAVNVGAETSPVQINAETMAAVETEGTRIFNNSGGADVGSVVGRNLIPERPASSAPVRVAQAEASEIVEPPPPPPGPGPTPTTPVVLQIPPAPEGAPPPEAVPEIAALLQPVTQAVEPTLLVMDPVETPVLDSEARRLINTVRAGFIAEIPDGKLRTILFEEFYFLHHFMQASDFSIQLDLNFIDYLLFGTARVEADTSLPKEAKRVIYLGGEKPYRL